MITGLLIFCLLLSMFTLWCSYHYYQVLIQENDQLKKELYDLMHDVEIVNRGISSMQDELCSQPNLNQDKL